MYKPRRLLFVSLTSFFQISHWILHSLKGQYFFVCKRYPLPNLNSLANRGLMFLKRLRQISEVCRIFFAQTLPSGEPLNVRQLSHINYPTTDLKRHEVRRATYICYQWQIQGRGSEGPGPPLFWVKKKSRPYNFYNVGFENLVLDQLIIPKLIFLFTLITCLLDIVLILY